ncbi:MAG: hypothetical protein HYT94_01405 [Parcubacteria group bacterium]|nr:hypothetical protein [Parcubacteria group bacterium]
MSAFDTAYFTEKKSQNRKRVTNVSGKAHEALEIATKVLRLCYPLRTVRGVHCYYNNTPIEPFLEAEHPSLAECDDPNTKKFSIPCKEYVVVDIYFLFGDHYASKNAQTAFVVEVAFPQNVERARWSSIARVRWTDLNWNRQGNFVGDNPVPQIIGETFVNDWM